MDRAGFEAALTREGFQVVVNKMKPDAVNPFHVHPFDARVMVVEGVMTIDRDGAERKAYAPGEWFEMPSGCRHSESAGPAGAVYVAGRRAPA